MTPSESDVPEIEIRDPGVEEEVDEPRQGMLVPLVVVPAMIVMLGVLIVALFGLVSGSESTPRSNLEVLLQGGANERQQAAFGLVRQILEYQHSLAEGREPEWDIDAGFLADVRAARAAYPEPKTPVDVWEPFVLSSIMAQFGDPDGVRQLIDAMRLSDSLDPDFDFRTNAVFVLGSIGRELEPALREAAAGAMVELLAGEDEGMALLAAGALQNLPTASSIPALRSLLERRRLDLRLQAALSLAELGDAAGVDVLRAAVHEAPYLEERELDPNRWSPPIVSETRQKVLEALAALDRLPPADELRRVADSDSDPNVRAKALELAAESRTP